VRRFTYDSLSRLLTAKNPESGTISYAYDNDGNLLQKISPAPNQTGTATQTISYCYDALHRVTGKAYGALSCPLSSAVMSYAYDSGSNAIGKLTQMIDQAGTVTYSYDILGRLTSETRTLTGANNAAISKTLSYDYNLDGSLKTLHYPSGCCHRLYAGFSRADVVRNRHCQQHQLRYGRELRTGQRTDRLCERQRRAGLHHQQLQLQQAPPAAHHVGFNSGPDGLLHRL
jgi:YD repeat-containing protein